MVASAWAVLRAARHGVHCTGGDHRHPGGRVRMRRPAGTRRSPTTRRVPPELSLARAGDLALIALGPTAIGVDVETVPEPATVAEVTAAAHPEERRRIEALRWPAGRGARLAALWARNEAYLKATGAGIGAGLGEVSLMGGAPVGWSLSDLDVGAGGGGAAAVRPRGTSRAGTVSARAQTGRRARGRCRTPAFRRSPSAAARHW